MKTFRKTVSLWMSLLLMLSCLPVGMASAATRPEMTNDSIPNGEYAVDFLFLEDGKTTASVSNTYMKIPGTKGKLIVQDGDIRFEHEITRTYYAYFEYLGYRPDGVPKAVIVDSVVQDMSGYREVTAHDAAAADRLVLRYEIDDISKLQDILMHINIPALSYNNWYNVQLSIDTSDVPVDEDGTGGGEPPTGPVTLAMLNELITVTESVYSSSTEGSDYGQYPEGSRAVLKLAITDTQTKLASVTEGDLEAYAELYEALDAALKHFQAQQRGADKTELQEILSELTSFLKAAKRNGETNGAPGLAGAAYISGEYDHTYIRHLDDHRAQANTYMDRADVTQGEVDGLIARIRTGLDEISQYRYVEHEPIKIYVLDTDQPVSTESIYADELEDTVTTIVRQDQYGTMDLIRGNITLNAQPDDNILYASTPYLDGTYTSPDVYEEYGMPEYAAAPWNIVLSTDGKLVYQPTLKWSDVDKDTLWQGLGHITYYYQGVKRSLYLSFNRDIHEQLKASLSEAAEAADKASKRESADLAAFDAVKAALQAAIDRVQPIAGNLNAIRQDIVAAAADLGEALDEFKKLARIGDPVDEESPGNGGGGGNEDPGPIGGGGLQDGFYYIDYDVYKYGTRSRSIAADYLVSPALLEVSGGRKTVSLTVTRSNEINGLKIAGSSGRVVSRDTAKNTRVVAFNLSNLSVVHNGWVKVDWDEYNYHHEYDIQFFFDEDTAEPAGSNPTVPSSRGNTPPPDGYEESEDPSAEEEQQETQETDNREPGAGEVVEQVTVFQDTEHHWARDVISRAVHLGFVQGFDDGTFRPDEQMTRKDIAVLLSKALQLEEFGSSHEFADLDNLSEEERAQIAKVAGVGLMLGSTGNNFLPDKVITRVELVVIMARAAGLELADDAVLSFADTEEIPEWARREVAAAAAAGLVNGKSNNMFDPFAPATRAEALTLVLRLLDALAAAQAEEAGADTVTESATETSEE